MMGSMYMSDVILNENLITTGYRKFWSVKGTATGYHRRPEDDIRTVRHRSRSCGAVYHRGRQELNRGAKTQKQDEFLPSATRDGILREPTGQIQRLPHYRVPQLSSSGENGNCANENIQGNGQRRTGFGDSSMVLTNTGDHHVTDGSRVTGMTDIVVDLNQDNLDLTWKNLLGSSAKTGFARLDTKTLQEIGWVSGAEETSDRRLTNAEDIYKLTKAEFKRLQDQVRDVSLSIRNKFRASSYQKLYQRATENPSQVYRSQLAASLRAFQQKQWPPLNHQELESNYIRCRPVTPAHVERPSTSCSVRAGTPTSRLLRPKSVPATSLRPKSASSGRRSETPSEARPGKFDTLSPMVISELMCRSERPSSGYDDDRSPDDKSPFVDELAAETKKLVENDDTSTTSGIDSGASDNEIATSDEDSEYEPDIDKDIVIPNLSLRPEKLDALYIPEPKRGWQQYDFDMSNIDLPPYEFANPFPEGIEDLDLKQMARLKWNWRNHVHVNTTHDPDLEGILDRLVEFEKLQQDTIDWEKKRAAQLKRQATKRAANAKPVIKDKRCDSSCLQATCFGDCPEKLAQQYTCEMCRQGYCTGTCKETKYEQRMRQPRLEEERPVTPKPPFPRACSSCQKRHNAKMLNANNLVLGTQRLNNATFTRGQSSAKAKDFRPKTPSTLSKDVLREFEKLNMDPVQPPRPTTAISGISRPRSRNSVFPGKSFSSQRKYSITDIDKVGANKKKRSRSSSKPKRPKTAG
ncbi:uncharacterized protein LOC127846506 isoform X3 [Dreissena polymorpha]|uniref:uncharacterized protein LOC127846506 isoform X3 n=1 Tax=Dreissena polymorpha TaxID=45954 RepID=UPI002263C959|nr:uncharacterized protein LOC127846506 isoform X3 [Dreissena polymorpha]